MRALPVLVAATLAGASVAAIAASGPRQPGPRVSVRIIRGTGVLMARGKRFVPRGANYVRLAELTNTSGSRVFYHSTFNVGSYDPSQASAVLRRMRGDRYNAVRVFLDGVCATACAGNPAGGISSTYAANVADFLRRAKANRIVVVLTTGEAPNVGGYADRLAALPHTTFDGVNRNYLTSEGVAANAKFWHDFVLALRAARAPLDAVLAYEPQNELHYDVKRAPLTLGQGRIQTANGKTYDLASMADKQRMLDDGMVFWIDRVRSAIRSADPAALVAAGLPQPPPPAYSAIAPVRAQAVLTRSSADVGDLHFYPGRGLDLATYARIDGLAGPSRKPLLFGELGASTSAYPTAPVAVAALRASIADSCNYGDGIHGWLLWTWDTSEQPGYWTAVAASGALERALAPPALPAPCGRGQRG